MTLTLDLLTSFVTMGVAIAGVGFGAYQLWQRRRAERREDLNRFVLNAIEHMTGGIQERNIGISVIAHEWHDAPHLRGLFVRVLTNQAIFVAHHGNLKRAHEMSNLRRIIDLLARASESDRQCFDEFYQELIRELSAAGQLDTSDRDKFLARLARTRS